MSFESELIILRTINDNKPVSQKQIETIKTNFINKLKDSFLFPNNEHLKNYTFPTYIPIDINDNKEFISLNNNKLYTNIVSTHFCSDFMSLYNYFNLNQYTGINQVILSPPTIKEMLQCIKYILTFKPSKELEILLDSDWIDVYGKLLPSFINRFQKCKSCMSAEDKEFEDIGQHILTRIKTIFETYLLLINENEDHYFIYDLIYYI